MQEYTPDFAKLNLFNADSYDTPDGRRTRWDKLLPGRLNFYCRNFRVFQQTGAIAARGRLDRSNQIIYANENFRIVEECGGKVHIRGLDNLRKLNGESVVIISNHMSLLETAILHCMLAPHMQFTFVIKEALTRVPYFREIMSSLHAIPVGRANPREDFKTVLEKGTELLHDNVSIVVFPQHTRSVEFKPEEFNTIGVKLARVAKARILPMALKTDFISTGRFLRDLGPLKREEPIHFEFGEPFEVEGNGKEAHQRVIDFIQSRLALWSQEPKS